MRQTSIPKNFVEALNSAFDENPEAINSLLAYRAPVPAADPVMEGEPQEETAIGMLDVLNAALDSVAPGKRVAIIYGPDGLEGFVIGRDRKSAPEPETKVE